MIWSSLKVIRKIEPNQEALKKRARRNPSAAQLERASELCGFSSIS